MSLQGTLYIFYEHITKNVFVHCRLYMHIWLLRVLPLDPTGALPLNPAGDFRPQIPCAHPTSKPWLRH